MTAVTREQISRRILLELAAHLAAGRSLLEQIGEDGRPPLTLAHRWHFTAQSLLRRSLTDDHPRLLAFDRHCYSGLLQRHRLEKAVALYGDSLPAAEEHGLPLRLATIRNLLEPLVMAPAEIVQPILAGSLWHALVMLATLLGLRGAADYPPVPALLRRLVEHAVIDPETSALLGSTDLSQIRLGAQSAIQLLEIARPGKHKPDHAAG